MKKEEYLNNQNVDDITNRIYNSILKYSKKPKFNFDIKEHALLIIDMQDYFLDKESHAFIPSANAIIGNIKSLQEFFNDNGRPVIFTRHINKKNLNGMMEKWWNDVILEENPLSKIYNQIILESQLIIEKSTYNAFLDTKLEQILNNFECKGVVVTGVLTHLCCETTAREAFARDFEVWFPIDSTATYCYEMHLSTFTNLSHGFCYPVLTKHLLKSNDGKL